MSDTKSSETTGYHLFLKPDGELQGKIRIIVDNLAQQYGGPVFDPHVTLLSHIVGTQEEVIAKATQLASQLHPFTITFGEIGMEDSFFRALYVRAHASAELMGAHTKALELFGLHNETTYLPHLSLLYGNMVADSKREVAAALTLPDNLEFSANKIYVYRTEGPATEWESVAELVLP